MLHDAPLTPPARRTARLAPAVRREGVDLAYGVHAPPSSRMRQKRAPPRRGVACRRRQNIGSLADSEEVLPNAPTRKRPVQHRSGAPGWNRTSDTRFRKHAEGVLASSLPCAIVLHGPRFLASTMLGRTQPCWAVVRRLVGNASASRAPESWPFPQHQTVRYPDLTKPSGLGRRSRRVTNAHSGSRVSRATTLAVSMPFLRETFSLRRGLLREHGHERTTVGVGVEHRRFDKFVRDTAGPCDRFSVATARGTIDPPPTGGCVNGPPSDSVDLT